MKHVTVRYYSHLSTRRGIQSDPVDSDAPTVLDLLHEIQAAHRLPLTTTMAKASVNDTFVEWSAPFADGDTITFIPPFAGG